ncbi:penicillin-binding protein [Cellulomonas sp. SG140]|uniref:penicillin-binding protein n=1 Tax=Cellulomonas sp. SG140 TaxID=2976536 RepID=UPI0021E88A23|nr:penicillin-binding protein [Cellulomonas sp. SG140]
MLGTFLGLIFVGLGAAVAAYATLKVPSPSAQVKFQTSTVYFANNADGSRGPVMGTFADQKRDIVDYSTLPSYVGKAVVASEDQSFYQNAGVDPRGIARALWNNLRGNAQQGASTLTEQYVKTYYKNRTTTNYIGKAEEAMLAIKIGRTESKDQILGRYLNTIYLGRDSYGIQAAAQSYFGVDAKDLTVSQAALLAGIIPSPNNWDPANAPDKAKARWNRVLDYMVKGGFLSQADRDKQEFPQTIQYKQSNAMAGTNGYLLQMVLDELQTSMKLSIGDIKTGGYTIITTIDPAVQNEAVRSANDLYSGQLANGATPNPRLRLAISTINQADGSIVALYGGADYLKDQRNAATYDNIQAGSTFKPFTLVAALEQGIGLKTEFNGASPQVIPGWDTPDHKVTNFANEQPGRIDLIRATSDSVNTVYAQLNLKVGPDKSAEVAKRAGVTTPQPVVGSNVLGAGDVHPLDMAAAYATYAAQGVQHTPFIVREVLDSTGKTVDKGGSAGQKAFAPDVMADAIYAMQHVVTNTTGTGHKWISPLNIPIAGKTGTSTDNKSAWFDGFTTSLTTAVAMSQLGEDNKSQDSITAFGGIKQVTGGDWPAKLWADYMKPVLAMPQWTPKSDFPQPAWIGNKPTATPTATPTDTATPTTAPTTQAPTTVQVPGGLVKSTEADASGALQNAGLAAVIVTAPSDTVPAGRVISASPASGTTVPAGSSVTLTVSTGPATPPPTTQAPAPSPSATAGGPAPKSTP